MDNKTLRKMAGISESMENLTTDEIYQEILAQYKNLDTYKPRDKQELRRTADAIIGSAKDLIKAVNV